MKIIANNYKPGEIVRFIRESVDLTQKDLSKNLKKNPYWIRDIELLKNRIYFDDLIKIANNCGYYLILINKNEYDNGKN